MFILYPAPLLDSFFSSSSILVEPLGSSKHSIMSSANNDTFTYFFAISVTLIPSCLITVPKSSSAMLNKSSESRQPHIFPYLKETLLVFAH